MINIVNKEDCCGCGACYSICPKQCITMQYDNEGFSYPCIDTNKCINCGLCEKTCPIKNKAKSNKQFERSAVIIQHKNCEICRQSTAGGAFTGIAEYVIENDGVVFGVEINENHFVHHIHVKTKDELWKFRNSKYVQSDTGDTYKLAKDYLESNKLVCYSGTPCQIEGLLKYLGKDYENLILVDVVCRAVPSPGIWKKYIEMTETVQGKISSVRFRDKTLGYQYSTMEMKYKRGTVNRGGIESHPWLRMFFSGMIIRPSCTECKFRNIYRKSDFTIWDCFNIYSIDKTFNENIGTTRMIIHTQKGKKIFDKIKKDFKYKVIPLDTAINGVAEMKISPNAHPRRHEFFADAQKLSMEELLNKYFPVTFKVKIKKNIRTILNKLGLDKTIKHILKKG